MAQNPSEGKLIYHITHINNLPSILKVGLLSRKKLLRNPSLSFTDIADSEILSKREQYKEALSQYVQSKQNLSVSVDTPCQSLAILAEILYTLIIKLFAVHCLCFLRIDALFDRVSFL